MAVISGTDYLNISNDLASAKDTTVSAKDDLFIAVYRVVMLQVILPEVDLLSEFWDTYLVNSQILSASTLFLGAVSALQEHVLRRSTNLSVDEYLWNNVWPSLVDPTFQTLSADAGFTISDMYVDLP
jgi:hypothetical protein